MAHRCSFLRPGSDPSNVRASVPPSTIIPSIDANETSSAMVGTGRLSPRVSGAQLAPLSGTSPVFSNGGPSASSMPVGGALPLGDKAPEKPPSDGSRWISGGEKDSRGDLPSAFGLQSEGHQWAPEPRPEDPPACEARRVRQNTAPPELPAQPRVNHPAPAGIINKTGDVAGQSGPGSASAGPHLLANSFNEHSSGACSAPHRGEEQS